MNCPRCESTSRRANRRWECTGCGYAFKARPPLTLEELQSRDEPARQPVADRPSLAPAPPPARAMPTEAPPPNRIRLGDIWADIQGRHHRAEHCVVDGLLLMTPIGHQLVPVAIDVTKPHPWQRVEWGGRP